MVVQSETLSVESWGMTSTDSSLYRSSESDYCSILDPIPVADAQVPEPAVLQSEVQGADAVEGADDMDPRGMPEVSLNAVQESAAENSDLEDAASATIDGVVPGGLQPFIPPLLQSSPIRQGSSECAVELELLRFLLSGGVLKLLSCRLNWSGICPLVRRILVCNLCGWNLGTKSRQPR